MNKLRLVVSAPRSFAGTDFTDVQSEIDKAVAEGHKVSVLAGAYLHGKVENAMGYDICAVLNSEDCVDWDKNLFKPGIYDAEVLNYSGTCKAYLWNSAKEPRGLVVDVEDTLYVQDAIKKYENRYYCL